MLAVQIPDGEQPVLEWIRRTALRPLLDALDGQSAARYLAAYGNALALAYPRQGDGRTLFPFRRLFFVARK